VRLAPIFYFPRQALTRWILIRHRLAFFVEASTAITGPWGLRARRPQQKNMRFFCFLLEVRRRRGSTGRPLWTNRRGFQVPGRPAAASAHVGDSLLCDNTALGNRIACERSNDLPPESTNGFCVTATSKSWRRMTWPCTRSRPGPGWPPIWRFFFPRFGPLQEIRASVSLLCHSRKALRRLRDSWGVRRPVPTTGRPRLLPWSVRRGLRRPSREPVLVLFCLLPHVRRSGSHRPQLHRAA